VLKRAVALLLSPLIAWHWPCSLRYMAIGPFSSGRESDEAQSFQLKLRLASHPTTGAYEVSIELAEVDVQVEVVDVDLRRAVRRAAEQCADRLCEHGYVVTAADVIGALEDALQDTEMARRGSQPLN
jgi:uncharacterized protein (UPF0147 family)